MPMDEFKRALIPGMIGFVLGGLVASAVAVGGFTLLTRRVSAFNEAMNRFTAQQAEFEALKQKYHFALPAPCQPLVLAEDRVESYLAIREAFLPEFLLLHAEQEVADKAHAEPKGVAARLVSGENNADRVNRGVGVRARFIRSLDASQMSPAEFWTLTGALYGSDDDLWLASIKQAARLAPDNSALLERYRTRIDVLKDPAFDSRFAAVAERGSKRPSGQVLILPPEGTAGR
jgi:hypothetical protein